MSRGLYGFRCEYCPGTVRERQLDREVFSHTRGVVILEDVPIGVCDQCHAHYYSAQVLKRVESVIDGTTPATRREEIPVAPF